MRVFAVSVLLLLMTALLLGSAAILWFGLNQRAILFLPDAAHYTPADFDIKGARIVTVEPEPGVPLTGWYWPPSSPDMKTVVYFHGNGNGIANALKGRVMEPFIGAGHGFLFATYRGFNGNPGTAGEGALYGDARAWIKSIETPTDQIVLYGMSLGTGIAVTMATEYPDVAGVILEAPYTSFAALIHHKYPLVPFSWALRHRFDSLSRIAAVTKPVLVMHGGRDTLVPVAQGRELCAAAPDCTLKIYDDAGHLDLNRHGAYIEALRFLRRSVGRSPA